jgi:ATP-dependent Clp protease ATP-binding subunit ClpC
MQAPERGDPSTFDAFTPQAKQALSLARAEALGFEHRSIGTEHLLLALIRQQDSIVAQVLSLRGIEAAAVQRAVESLTGRAYQPVVPDQVTLTWRSWRVIELAKDEPRRMGHSSIGTEHLVLGLVREGDGIAAGILVSQGLQLETVRQATLDALVEHNDPS